MTRKVWVAFLARHYKLVAPTTQDIYITSCPAAAGSPRVPPLPQCPGALDDLGAFAARRRLEGELAATRWHWLDHAGLAAGRAGVGALPHLRSGAPAADVSPLLHERVYRAIVCPRTH